MELGAILVARNLATPEQIEQALQLQKQNGGRLGDNLVAMGIIDQAQLDQILNASPKAPHDIADTGIPQGDLLNLMIKTMNSGELETPSRIAEAMKLPSRITNILLEDGLNRKYFEILGASGAGAMLSEMRYRLTSQGRERLAEAMEQNLYVGPVPISLTQYYDQINLQKITNERINQDDIKQAFGDLVVSEQFVSNIGPAINSGRCILLYGAPGNGKTSVAERVAGIFANVIYIPYALYVDGQIIKVFDPGVHEPVETNEKKAASGSVRVDVRRETVDRRWVTCRRPVVITGGELNMEMLDLKYNPQARFYEAPLHVKALGGTFIIDDFGRQLVTPEELLNRWIVPLQNRVDFLKLHTGKSFAVPFDELIIFSTNIEPDDLMDPAFLRRIPYKLETVSPTLEQFHQIFIHSAKAEGLELSPEMFKFVVEELTVHNDYELACYQPQFIVEQVVSACKYEGIRPEFRQDLVAKALGNLYARSRTRRRKTAARVSAGSSTSGQVGKSAGSRLGRGSGRDEGGTNGSRPRMISGGTSENPGSLNA